MTIATTAKIYPWAKIIHTGANLSVGEHSQIDDFAFVNAGKMCTIGRFVHIASFVSIIGGGEFTIDDFAGLSAGCRVITGTDDYQGPFLTNPTVPQEFTNYQISHVTIEEHAIVGTNAVIFPGVTIGEGAAVGACAVIRRDLPPWGIYAGDPLRKIGERDRVAILEKKRLLLEKLSSPQARSGEPDHDPPLTGGAPRLPGGRTGSSIPP
jgi:galactoside O-acetyltransferase